MMAFYRSNRRWHRQVGIIIILKWCGFMRGREPFTPLHQINTLSIGNSCVEASQANIMFPGQRSFQLNQSMYPMAKTIKRTRNTYKTNTHIVDNIQIYRQQLKLSRCWKYIITFLNGNHVSFHIYIDWLILTELKKKIPFV